MSSEMRVPKKDTAVRKTTTQKIWWDGEIALRWLNTMRGGRGRKD